MELHPLCVMFLLAGFIHSTQTESPKPVVIMKPDKQLFIGEKGTFICDIQSAKDTEWTYIWNNKKYTESLDYKTQEFSISSVTVSDSGTYTCRGKISDSQFTEDSDPVTLTVSDKPKPEITSSLKGDVLTGNSVTLYCTLKPQSAGWKFYWIKPTQNNWTETESDSYTISSVRVSDRGQYWCRARRGNRVYYTSYSDALSLTVIVSSKPVVVIKPDSQVFRGQSVTFRCDKQSAEDTEWTYIWYKKDYTESLDYKTQEFNISSVTDSDSGIYTCRGMSSDSQFSEASDPVTLTVSAATSVLKLLSSVVTASVYVLVTIILAVKCYRARAEPDEDNRPYRVIEAEMSF